MEEMKKLKTTFRIYSIVLLISILLTFVGGKTFAKSYEIETSRGLQTVSCPDNQTLEEAFKTMSVLYLEEKWDHEDLIKSSSTLTNSLDENEAITDRLQTQYDNLLSDYNDLVTLYKIKTKKRLFSPAALLNIGYEFNSTSPAFEILLGGQILETIDIYTSISFPFKVGLALGISWK